MWDGSGLVARLEEKELQLNHWVVRRNSQKQKILPDQKKPKEQLQDFSGILEMR